MNYIQEAEKRLKHYRDLISSVDRMNRDIARIVKRSSPSELNAVAMEITGVHCSKTDDALNVLYELQTLREAIEETTQEIASIDEILKDISRDKGCHLYGKVLYLWYVKHASSEDIAKEIRYSARQVYNIKGAAVRKFAIHILGIKALKAL